MSDAYEHLTDYELARQVVVDIGAPDDSVSDGVWELFRPAYDKAVALAARLQGPYCNAESCPNEHMESFPWCPWHRPESFGPLPPDFPPNPNPVGPA